MIYSLSPLPKLQFVDLSGAPLSGGLLYTFEAGTTTPLATYTDTTGSTSNPNPVVLDSYGSANVWLGLSSYKFVLENSSGTVIFTVDDISSPYGLLSLGDGLNGSNLVQFLQAGAGAVARPVQAKLRDRYSVKDFGAVGDGVTNDTAAISLAVSAACAANKELFFPAGTYLGVLPNVDSSFRIVGEGIAQTIIRRPPATSGPVAQFSGEIDLHLQDITFDGNAANNSNAAHVVTIASGLSQSHVTRCRFTGAAGYGVGLDIGNANANKLSTGLHRVVFCQIDTNSSGGVQITQENRVHVLDCEIYNNGSSGSGNGVTVSWFTFPPVASSQQEIVISRNQLYGNGSAGCFVLGSIVGGTDAEPLFGVRPNSNTNVSISDNQCYLNGGYGLVCQADGCVVSNNISSNNGDYSSLDASAFAGILVNSASASVSGNVCSGNSGYGIDLGGSSYFSCTGNYIGNNATVAGGGFIGLNLGACQYGTVVGNMIESNGPSSTGINIMIPGYDGGTNAFPSLTTDLKIDGNMIICGGGSTRVGIRLYGNPTNCSVTNNHIQGGNVNSAIEIRTNAPVKCTGNVSDQASMAGVSIATSPGLVIPDWAETIYLAGTASVTNIQTYSQNALYQAVVEAVMINGGSGYNPASAPAVTISGGGGSGATAVAAVSGAGIVVNITIVNGGSGYTSVPTITVTPPTSGTTATANAIVNCNNVAGRNVTFFFGSAITLNNTNNIVLPASSIPVAMNSIAEFMGNTDGKLYLKSRTT